MADDMLNLNRVESGGPPVALPTSSGFGSQLLNGIAVGNRGNVNLDYRPEGLSVDIAIPIEGSSR